MAWVVLLRGVNVGGGRRLLTSQFAEQVPELDLVNIGAAGTFVARTSASEKGVRAAIERALPFETEIYLCPGNEIQQLVRSDPFLPFPATTKPCLTVLESTAPTTIAVPYYVPPAPGWEVQVIEIRGRYVLSVYRRRNDRLTYPNPVIEKVLHLGATTRGWPTIVALDKVLQAAGPTRVR
jgi:uncharacterized protein (DUF1697 family)